MTATLSLRVQGSFKVAAGAHKVAAALVVAGWAAEMVAGWAAETAVVWAAVMAAVQAAARVEGCMQWMQRRWRCVGPV
jgi:hypothetical protein